MEVKRIKIHGFKHAPLVREVPTITHKVETTSGKKVTIKTPSDWKLKDIVDAIVERLTK